MVTSKSFLFQSELSWLETFDIMKISTKESILPTTTRCLKCKQYYTNIYEDRVFGCIWYYCFWCRASGSIVNFASNLWKVSNEKAIDIFIDNLINPKTNKWKFRKSGQLRFEERIEELNDIWKISKDPRLSGSNSVRRLILKAFKARSGGILKNWHRFCNFMGCFPVNSLKNIFPKYYVEFLKTNHNFDHILVIPMFDFPGRISGFYILDENLKGKYIGNMYNLLGRESGGLAGLESINDDIHYAFSDKVFIFDDIKDMLNINIRHLTNYKVSLPLLAFDKTMQMDVVNIGQFLQTKDVIICGKELTPQLLRLAKNLNGRLSVSDYITETEHPVKFLTERHNSAISWKDAVEDYLKSKNKEEINNVIMSLEFSDEEMEEFLDVCSVNIRDKIFETLNEKRYISSSSNWGDVIESNEKWYVKKNNRFNLLSDGIVKIDEIAYLRKGGGGVCRGRVLYREKEYEFTEKIKNMENNLLKWMRNFLLKESAGLLNFSTIKTENLFNVCCRFHPPRILDYYKRYGWNIKQGVFNFYNFILTPNGEINKKDYLQRQQNKLEHVPTKNIEIPKKPISRKHLKRLNARNNHPELFWAIMTTIIENVVSSFYSRGKRKVLVIGKGAQSFCSKVLEYSGCVTVSPDEFSGENIRRIKGLSSWPLFIPNDKLDTSFLKKERNWFVCTKNPISAISIGLYHEWDWLYHDEEIEVPNYEDSISKFVGSYFKWLTENRMNIKKYKQKSFDFLVRKNLKKYLIENNINPQKLMMSENKIIRYKKYSGQHAIKKIIVYLKYLIKMKIIEPTQKKGGFYVPKIILNKILEERGYKKVVFDHVCFLKFALKSVVIEDNEEEFIFNPDWWKKEIENATIQ